MTVKETDAGEERLESMAGSSGDRLAVKVGGKNSKKVDKSEGYGKASQSGHEVAKSLDHEMSAARVCFLRPPPRTPVLTQLAPCQV